MRTSECGSEFAVLEPLVFYSYLE